MDFSILKLILVALTTTATALLSYYGRAVFHDGLRPLMPELIEGRMKRPEMSSIAFGLSVGFIASVGISFTLSTGLLNPWLLFLPTDILGVFAGSAWLAAVLGCAWGVAVVSGLTVVQSFFTLFPVDFIGALGQLSSPVLAGFALFPVLAIIYQFGWKKGVFSAAIVLLVRTFIAQGFLPKDISLLPEAGELFIGTILLVIFALWQDRKSKADEGVDEGESLFEERTTRIYKGLPFFAIVGALVAVIANLHYFAGSEVSVYTLHDAYTAKSASHSSSLVHQAALADFLRAIGFIPLIATTALTTGVYGVLGLTFVLPIGYIMPNPILAALAGAAMLSLEVLVLSRLGKVLERFPALREASDNIRTSISMVMEIALLIGSVLAVIKMGDFTGFTIFAILYFINEATGRPIIRLAVAPLGAIVTGILLNILYFLHLFTP
ncbi:membrane protein [Pullulanibacillus camelliae]|uniref:Membrane protein n=1 Tax=Pullulanibacillus camelliae TaxID=1707096 RepID=A0A8J2YMN2_9BACL|nr:YhfT family protein [Pullulanibacillus camelliae]GGE55355.1 membrane protein [Pullulanibacillus camelliae]